MICFENISVYKHCSTIQFCIQFINRQVAVESVLDSAVLFLLPGLLLGQVQPQPGWDVDWLDTVGSQNEQERQLQVSWNGAHISKRVH